MDGLDDRSSAPTGWTLFAAVTATDTPTETPTETPTATPTETPTGTRVPIGGACSDTFDCEPQLTCVDGTCIFGAPAPALSTRELPLAIIVLLAVGLLALMRTARRSDQ
jgi:hypothetical protein